MYCEQWCTVSDNVFDVQNVLLFLCVNGTKHTNFDLFFFWSSNVLSIQLNFSCLNYRLYFTRLKFMPYNFMNTPLSIVSSSLFSIMLFSNTFYFHFYTFWTWFVLVSTYLNKIQWENSPYAQISVRSIVHCLRCIVSGKSFILPSATWTSDAKKRLCVLFLMTIALLFARFKVMGSQLPVFTRYVNELIIIFN